VQFQSHASVVGCIEDFGVVLQRIGYRRSWRVSRPCPTITALFSYWLLMLAYQLIAERNLRAQVTLPGVPRLTGYPLITAYKN